MVARQGPRQTLNGRLTRFLSALMSMNNNRWCWLVISQDLKNFSWNWVYFENNCPGIGNLVQNNNRVVIKKKPRFWLPHHRRYNWAQRFLRERRFKLSDRPRGRDPLKKKGNCKSRRVYPMVKFPVVLYSQEEREAEADPRPETLEPIRGQAKVQNGVPVLHMPTGQEGRLHDIAGPPKCIPALQDRRKVIKA
ncbi:hypothetical protein AX774_g4312 [Zancudomyces culisetae]|uniref:Uncharacterized protein n=1 Tax=Zancudomyces culisetae TaxID=1213189 RepID=A0A1R1PMU7_ZANCU|nr:hypothetical protein AX774_g4312 [Zancudomyces culisetae]|eukprot:OMH82212.1 hypothetical protein AX774_g4312 [Zancudomyces culisetae]